MSTENANADTSTTETVEQSLDQFETEFFSDTKAPVETPTVEDTVEDDSTPDEAVEDTTEDISEDTDTEDSTDEESDDNDVDESPKKETRAEKRIRELNAKYREAERRAEEAERRAEEAERSKADKSTKEQKPVETNTDEGPKAPHWDDEDSEGNKVYPLGQFDPKFNADLVRYTIQEENRRLDEQRTQTEAQRKQQEAEAAVQAQWEGKLAPVQERYPDFQDKGQELIDQFSDLEPNYARYLTDTLRNIDNGPEVLYYLANNLDLANDIVKQGATKATIALGRISAQLDKNEPSSPTPTRTNVTKAPPPPPKARGTAPPKTKNLDDLEDFESVFFNR